ncbi:MAG: hypothetical protein ACREM3_27840, partial [Candidatus Rokuibacteriota bacterium]
PGEPSAVRIRVVAAEDPKSVLGSVREACAEHPGAVPVFVHVLLPGREVVVRSRALAVDPAPLLLERLAALLGPTATVVEHAGGA